MLKKNVSVILLFSLSLILLGSCAKEGPTGPIGNTGPDLYGNITGYVSLYDKYGSKVAANLGLVNVYLNGGNIPVTLDDTTGLYSILSIANGTYYITAIADSGFAATTIYNVNIIDNTLYRDIKLSAYPDSFLTSFSAFYNTGSANDSLVISVVPDTRDRNCIVFADSVAAVGSGTSSYLLNYVCSIPANATSVTLLVPGQDLTNLGFVPGRNAYFAAYSYVVNDASVYEDQATGRNVYNAVNINPLTASAIVP